MSGAHTVLGIDGSLTAYGWAIVSAGRVLSAGCWRTKPPDRKRHLYDADADGERVDRIAYNLANVIEVWEPDACVVEAPAGSRHARSAVALGLVYGLTRGVWIALRGAGLARHRPIRTVQAHEAKMFCGGSRTATKLDVARAVMRLTGYRSMTGSAVEREAEYDAIAVALAGIQAL